MKIEFIKGDSNINNNWNTRTLRWHGRIVRSMGTFQPAGCIEFEIKEDRETIKTYKENHITVIKQPTKLKTIKILFHELCHWFVHSVFKHKYSTQRKWHNRIDKYL